MRAAVRALHHSLFGGCFVYTLLWGEKCSEKPSVHSVNCHVECGNSQPEGKLNEA